MHVSLDGVTVDVPTPATLGELLEGLLPMVDPARLVTGVLVDDRAVDGSDLGALAGVRLGGGERVAIVTEAPQDFARARRREIPAHLRRIADRLGVAASGFEIGDAGPANRTLAEAARELSLVLELDRQLAVLDAEPAGCAGIAETVRRVGPHLEEAERDRRWTDVARLLTDEIVPALRLVPNA
jgi:hypothetical protein